MIKCVCYKATWTVALVSGGQVGEVGGASAEVGEVTLPAAHLAAHGGQYAVHVPSAQV